MNTLPVAPASTEYWYRKASAAGIPLSGTFELTPYNAKDLPEMAAFSKHNNLILQVATYMFPPVRKDGRLTGTNLFR